MKKLVINICDKIALFLLDISDSLEPMNALEDRLFKYRQIERLMGELEISSYVSPMKKVEAK
jgi:hypothetical protein